MSRAFAVCCVLALLAFAGTARAEDWFTDNFDDGIIDPAHWSWGGTITESDGALQLRREDPGDSIRTNGTYSGDWSIDLDARLNEIVWNDMFHGLSVTGASGAGISFGFSMYGKLYLAVSDGQGGTYYLYGPNGSNLPGQWQHWRIDRQSGQAHILVNGIDLFGQGFAVPEDAVVRLPGLYEDGDGGQHVGITWSSVDNFVIAPVTSGVANGPEIRPESWGEVKNHYTP